jgi:hypothetical protein
MAVASADPAERPTTVTGSRAAAPARGTRVAG